MNVLNYRLPVVIGVPNFQIEANLIQFNNSTIEGYKNIDVNPDCDKIYLWKITLMLVVIDTITGSKHTHTPISIPDPITGLPRV